MGKKSFAEKYGLVGKGNKIRISKETEARIKELRAQGKRVAAAGKHFAKTCKILFGVEGKPGAPTGEGE